MNKTVQAMTPYSVNPFAFIFPVIALLAVLCFLTYAAVDRLGLEVQSTVGTVASKQFNKGGKSYYTTIIDGRSVVQSQETAETYVVVIDVGNERTSGLVSKLLYESLQPNDNVQVKVRRRRITKKLEVVNVTR